jgi:glycosyltransferase involved in cell wall biosynthesis
LIVLTSFWPTRENPVSGIFVAQQVRAMIAGGFRVVVLLQKPLHKPRIEYLGCGELDLPQPAIEFHEISFPMIPDRFVKYAMTLTGWSGRVLGKRVGKALSTSVRDQRPLGYIVHGMRYGGMSIGSWRSLVQRPVQLVIHGLDPIFDAGDPAAKLVLAETVKNADQIVVVGQPLIDHVASLGFDRKNIAVIANGTTLPLEEPAADKTANHIVSVSNLTRIKGIDLNLKALAAIRADDPALDWSYRIVGDGVERKALELLSVELGLTDRVHFCGRLSYDETMREIAAGSIFSLPSWAEAFGIAYLEAMARRTAVIGCRNWGAEESVVHEENGLLVEPQSVASLREALERLLRDPELRHRLSRAAVQTAKHFSWDRNVAETVALLRSDYRPAVTAKAS